MKKIITFLFSIFGLFLFSQTPDASNTLYVNINVTGGNGSGDSWANAIPQLSDALKYARQQYNTNNAVYDAQPLKIFVAKGTYKPLYSARNGYFTQTGSADPAYSDQDNAFVMVKNVQVYGGFDPDNGIDDLTDTRIFGANGSVLSGEIGDIYDINYPYINANHVVIASGDVGNALLNGFTITRAFSKSTNAMLTVFIYPVLDAFGAMYCVRSSPTVENCIFTDNHTSGGNMFNYQQSSPTIINCTFINNGTAGNGGAIYNSTNSSPTITNCSFTENSAASNGGAIYNSSNSNPIITNCSFTDNSSRSNGGAIWNSASSPIITNSLFANNRARGGNISNPIGNGGAIYNETTSSPVLTNVSIANNTGANAFYSTGTGSTTFYNSIVFGTVSATYTAQYSLIEGNTDFTNGNINMTGITVSDVFTDNTNGDYTLKYTSPVIDMGNNTFNSTTLDLAGNARIYNSANGGIIDLGAYESEYAIFALTPDANGIIYVKETAIGSTNGSSWNNATSDLHNAIFANGVQKVFVAKGNYNVGSTSFIMKNNVEIYGGFDPDNEIDDLSDTRILPNETAFEGSVLNGENQRPVIWNYDNGLNNTAILDGFTVKNGNNNDNAGGIMNVIASPTYRNLVIKNNAAKKGGGMYNHIASPIINNVIFKDNTATEDGGGILNNQNSNAILTNVKFQNNTADWGGGMFNYGSSPIMDTIEIIGNSTSNDGGGIYNQSNSNPVMTNMKIQNNTAVYAGGIINDDHSSPTMSNITITGNTATIDGGGIYNYVNSNPEMTNVTITGNTAVQGGGMFNDDNSNPTLTNVLIAENTATTNGGAMYNQDSSSPVLINVTITNNIATKAVYNDNSTTSVKNSIVFGSIEGSFTAEYSLVGGNANILNGNLDGTAYVQNDIFTDYANGDYTLKSTSPVIDKGNNALFANLDENTKDLAGNQRVYDFANGGILDLGAYEYQGNSETLSTVTVSGYKIMVYPNPFSEILKISDVKEVQSISVFDNSGRLVKSVKPFVELNFSVLNEGTYFLVLNMKDTTSKTFKIIKK